MEQLTLSPVIKVQGNVHLPGSKSLSNRALLLAALSTGQTRLTNLLDSDDIRHMLVALKALGVKFVLSENNTQCVVQGIGGKFKHVGQLSLFLGNAGTAMRPLCAALAFLTLMYCLPVNRAWKKGPLAIWPTSLFKLALTLLM